MERLDPAWSEEWAGAPDSSRAGSASADWSIEATTWPVATQNLAVEVCKLVNSKPTAAELVQRCRQALSASAKAYHVYMGLVCSSFGAKTMQAGNAMQIDSPRTFWLELRRAGFVGVLVGYMSTFDLKDEVRMRGACSVS